MIDVFSSFKRLHMILREKKVFRHIQLIFLGSQIQIVKLTEFNQTLSALDFPSRIMGTLAKTLRSEKPLQRSDCQLTEMRFLPNADRLQPGM